MKNFLLFGLCVCLLIVSCVNPIAVGEKLAPNEVQNVKVNFDAGRNQVLVTWDKLPNDQVSFYQIYRITLDSLDPSIEYQNWLPTERRAAINKDSSSFWDVLGLSNTIYCYGVRAAVISLRYNGYADTSYGLMKASDLKQIPVGADIGFSINNNALFTSDDHVKLVNIDPDSRLKSVRYTNSIHTFLRNKISGNKVEVNFSDPKNPPDTNFLKQLVPTFIKDYTYTLLTADVEMVDIPDFDAPDSLNIVKSQDPPFDEQHNFLWRLKHGNGDKKVYVERAYKTDLQGKTQKTDTVVDDIKIAPYRIKMDIRNQTSGANITMRKVIQTASGNIDLYVYKPFINFSVSIFADTTIEQDFSYWIAIGDSSQGPLDGKAAQFLETAPRFAKLTGLGATHDDDKVYSYSFDPSNAEGKVNLSQLIKTLGRGPNIPEIDGGQLPPLFKLRGSSTRLNETAVPGSYYGKNPQRLVGTTLSGSQLTISGTPNELYNRILNMSKTQRFVYGQKEVIVFARFVGKKFGDTRMCTIGSTLSGDPLQKLTKTRFDLYAPAVLFNTDVTSSTTLNNASLPITAPFVFALQGSGGVRDGGAANVVGIDLIISKVDDQLNWVTPVYTPLPPGTIPPIIFADTISVDYLLAQRHSVFPFPIKTISANIAGVQWKLDPSDWPSGRYLMAVVTKDQFGNTGLAPATSTALFSNPWLVTVQTGK